MREFFFSQYYYLPPLLYVNWMAWSVKSINGFQTAMHWACKRGDENLAKLLAGVNRTLVNERSVCILLAHIKCLLKLRQIF